MLDGRETGQDNVFDSDNETGAGIGLDTAGAPTLVLPNDPGSGGASLATAGSGAPSPEGEGSHEVAGLAAENVKRDLA